MITMFHVMLFSIYFLFKQKTAYEMRIREWRLDVCAFVLKSWYVASYNGGADSAQLIDAGGYRFLHIGFEMAPSDAVLKWAEGVIKRYPRLPTTVRTHSFLNLAIGTASGSARECQIV